MTPDANSAHGPTAASYHRPVIRSAVLSALLLALAACAGAASPAPTTSPSVEPSPSSSASDAVPAIVGEWVGMHDCQRIVTMLTDAGQTEFLADPLEQLVPGDPNVASADPATACEGAVQRKHSHFFTAAGEFGSKDYRGQRVDDGTYTLEGDDRIVIGGQTFKYEIHGDELSLEPEPVDISGCTTKECRFTATWVLMVAMPGTTWKRGEIPVS